ncbi:MAG: phosphate acetyltransferase [Calditrichaeota bacterium]|nr:MAG: phosphate acetyltransferase [Calditrichota bacterium]
MNILEQIRQRAKANPKVIVLSEIQDERTLHAAQKISEEKIANVILVGNSKNAPKGILTIEPETSPRFEGFVEDFYERRKAKGITLEQARETIKDPLFFGNYLVKFGFAHGSVAGAVNSTANVLRAGLQVVGVAKGISVVSSYFLMSHNENAYIFSDCGVVPNPNSEQLSDIAFSASKNFELVVEQTPKVAFLSFSTKGSAKHSDVEKVCEALGIFQSKHPEILSDGELQFDAAFVPSVGKRKAPESKVAGEANVFIFPDLDSGNIAYKIAQRMGGAEAIGPIVQGLAKPCFDLSRGCSVEDIVNAVAICAIS